jgi:hypothetical protein
LPAMGMAAEGFGEPVNGTLSRMALGADRRPISTADGGTGLGANRGSWLVRPRGGAAYRRCGRRQALPFGVAVRLGIERGCADRA